MLRTASALLREQDKLFDAIRRDEGLAGLCAKLALVGTLGAMAFGAAVGFYVGRVHPLLTMAKMPVFFIATLVLCFSLMHIVLLVNGAVLHLRQTLTLSLAGLSVTTLSLGALAPITGFLGLSAALPHYPTYLGLWLMNAFAGVVAGFVGVSVLARGLRKVTGKERVRGILILWLLIYQFVGAQVAWILRPWIGSSYDIEGLYNLKHGLEGNFYVAVWEVLVAFVSGTGGTV